jgi:MFS family permease
MYPLIERACGSNEMAASFTYFLGALCMSVPALCLTSSSTSSCFEPILVAFIIVEFGVGMFGPASGTLRSKYVPDQLQGAILNIFRLPLNACVVIGTKLSDKYSGGTVYWVVCSWFMLAAIIQASMAWDVAEDEGRTKKNGMNGHGNGLGPESVMSAPDSPSRYPKRDRTPTKGRKQE